MLWGLFDMGFPCHCVQGFSPLTFYHTDVIILMSNFFAIKLDKTSNIRVSSMKKAEARRASTNFQGLTHNHRALSWPRHPRSPWHWHPKREPSLSDVRILLSPSSSVEVDADPNRKIFSLLHLRRPRIHRIKGPFTLILGGYFKDPPRSGSRRAPFSPSNGYQTPSRDSFALSAPTVPSTIETFVWNLLKDPEAYGVRFIPRHSMGPQPVSFLRSRTTASG